MLLLAVSTSSILGTRFLLKKQKENCKTEGQSSENAQHERTVG